MRAASIWRPRIPREAAIAAAALRGLIVFAAPAGAYADAERVGVSYVDPSLSGRQATDSMVHRVYGGSQRRSSGRTRSVLNRNPWGWLAMLG